MVRKFCLHFLLLMATFYSWTVALAIEPIAKLVKSESPKIDGLVWEATAPALSMSKAEFDPENEELSKILEKLKVTVKVKGRFSKTTKGWTVLLKDKAMEMKPDGSFEINFLMDEKSKFVDLTAVSEEGAIENEKIGTEIENFDVFVAFLKQKKSPHYWAFQLGYFGALYSQQNVPEVSQKLIELGGQYRVNLLPDLLHSEIASQLYFPISKAEPDFGKMIFASSELKLFYAFPYLPLDPEVWQTKIGGGFFVKSMAVTPPRFGYALSGGLMIEPELQYSIFSNHFIVARVALGVVTSNFNPLYVMKQQLRRIKLRWLYELTEKERLFAEVSMSQFLLNTAKVNEVTSGFTLGYQLP